MVRGDDDRIVAVATRRSVAAVVMLVVGVGFVLWLRRLIAAGKASGQWNAADEA